MPMKRVWGHVLTGTIAAAGIAIAAMGDAGCVHDDSSIFVSQVLAPQFVTPGMACIFTSDPTQASINSGTLDVAVTSNYFAEILVGNQLVPRGDPNQPQTETSFVNVQGAVITVNDTQGNQLDSFTQVAATTVPPSSGTTPGYAPINLPILSDKVVAPIFANLSQRMPRNSGARVIANIRFFGKTLGGDSVESNLFGFPVDICYGCLISFPPSGNCLLAATSTSSTSVPCYPGQDFEVPCTACLAQSMVCLDGLPQTTGSE
jgi:hypothetical protein